MTTLPAVVALGSFIRSTRYEDLPASVQVDAKMCVLDALGSALGGRNTPPTRLALGHAETLGGGAASCWLTNARRTAQDSVFVNSVLVQSATLDDSLNPHLTSVVPPTALTVGEAERRTGAEVLAAIALGSETTRRVDSGRISDANTARGIRRSTVSVAFGAAAAAAYLMGLSARGIADALALTTGLCPAAGGYESVGKQEASDRYVQMAASARSGVFAAELARAGYTGGDTALEGRDGFYFLHTGRADPPPELLEDLGQRWHLDGLMLSPYPGPIFNIYPIYCAERLVRDHALDSEDIAGVEVIAFAVLPQLTAVHDRGPFKHFEQAHSSRYFGVAAALVFGTFDIDVLLRALGDPRVDAMAQRIEFTGIDPGSYRGLPTTSSVKITLKSGQVLTARGSDMPDWTIRPDWDGMVARFHRLTATAIPEERRREIVSEVQELEKRSDCRDLIRMLSQP